MAKPCVSCGVNIESAENSVSFPCPSCGETQINRCGNCRKEGKKFACPNCGQEGP